MKTNTEIYAELNAALRLSELEDIKSVASTQAGRSLLQRIFAMAFIFSGTYTGEALSGAFNEGKRSVGLALREDLMRVAPEKFISMERATKEREEQYGKRIAELAETEEE